MTLADEKKMLVEELRTLFSPNRQKPADKAKALLWMIDRHGKEIVIEALQELSVQKG